MTNPGYAHLPSLNGLRAFEAAARLLSFTLAARELNVTQGAISRQIKLLEQELDVFLFHRRHRSLTLTEQGRILLSPLTRAFDLMTQGVTRLKNQQQDLSLKLHPTFAIRWLIPRLHLFQSQYPDIRIRLTTSGINADFFRENFDAGITHLGEKIPGVHRQVILTEQLIPVCSPKLLQGHPPLARPEDVKRHTLLHNNPDMKEWAAWAEQNKISDLSLERGQIFEVDDAALQAATAGLGIALGDLFLVRDELLSGRLTAPLGLTPIQTGCYYFSWPDFNNNDRGVCAFRNWLMKALEDTPL